MSAALENLLVALQDVEDLLRVHEHLTGRSVGRPSADVDLEVLSRSAIVLCVAMWQDYLEQAVRKASELMIGAAGSPDSLPEGLRRKVACRVREAIESDSDLLTVFNLAGDGYKKEATDWVQETLEVLNTPDSRNSDNLLRTCLGVSPDFENMQWANMRTSAAGKLDALMQRRHDIAHHGRTGRRQWKSQAARDFSFIRSLCRRVDGLIGHRLRGLPNVEW